MTLSVTCRSARQAVHCSIAIDYSTNALADTGCKEAYWGCASSSCWLIKEHKHKHMPVLRLLLSAKLT